MAAVKRKKAIILARVSTAGQAEEELPIDGQIEAGHAEAARLDAEVVKVFVEEGVSGRKLKRDVFQEAIDYCGLFAIDYFILWNTARFARHRALAAWTKFNLRKLGTELVYVSQKINTATDEGWLLEGLFELFDENYSRTVSKDTLRSMMKNARDGFFNGGAVPYGYVAVPEGKRKRLAVREDEAMVVRRLFAESLQGAGVKSLALWLNQAGILRRGRPWTKNTVNYLLKNSVYAGYVTFNRMNNATKAKRPADEWIAVKSHAAIVSDEDFKAVQEILASRAPEKEGGSPHSQFLFTGLLKCAKCGEGMQIRTGTGRGKKVYNYYECGGSIRGKGCTSRMIPGEPFDRLMLDELMKRVLCREEIARIAAQIDALSGTWAKQRAARRQVLVAQLRELEGRRRNLFDLLEEHGKASPNLADLTVRLRELNGHIKALEASLTELEAAEAPEFSAGPEVIEDLAEFVESVVKNGSPKKVREFLCTFVESVEVDADTAVMNLVPGRLFGGDDPVRSNGKWLPDSVMLRTTVRIELTGKLRRAA